MTLHARSLLFSLALLAACAVDQDADTAAPGFDLDEHPEDLGKADYACTDYPGGTLSGDDLLVLVNKDPGQQLGADWAPRDVTAIPRSLMMPGRSGDLRGPVVERLVALVEAASSDGVSLGVRSAYRSFQTQCATFSYKVQQHGIEHARRFSAAPGRSQHQLGTTVDITGADLGWRLTQDMGDTPQGRWLAANAFRFGFALSYPEGHEKETGYAYEPWHFRYIGVEAASEMRDEGLILETYLDHCQAGDAALSCPREVFPDPIANAGFIGGLCETNLECEGIGPGAYCLHEGLSSGHCTLPCDRFCPDRAGFNAATFCADGPDGGLCRSQCDSAMFPDGGCREGYACEGATRPDGSKAADVCVPAL